MKRLARGDDVTLLDAMQRRRRRIAARGEPQGVRKGDNVKERSCPRCGLRECAPPGPAPDITLNDAKAILEWHAFNLGAQGEATKAHAIRVLIDALEAPRSTLKSAPPLTPEERPHSCLACDYEATRAVNRNEPPLRLLAKCPKVGQRIREDALGRLKRRGAMCVCGGRGTCHACAVEGTG